MDLQVAHITKSFSKLKPTPTVSKNLNRREDRSFVLIASTKCNQETAGAEPLELEEWIIMVE